MTLRVVFQRFSLLVVGAVMILLGTMSTQAQTYNETTLYQLTDTDGWSPTNLIEAADGNFYGIATFGGLSAGATPALVCQDSVEGCGTIFKISPSGAYTVLYTFQGGVDGAFPTALVQGGDGNLYGAAAFGGNIPTGPQCGSQIYCTGYGTIFKLSMSGAFSVLYAFSNTSDGAYPTSLIEASDGNFYGASYSNTIFRISQAGNFAAVFTFGGTSGEYPTGIVQGSDGNLYGTTQAAGSSSACDGWGCGTVYKMSLSGAFSTIYTFSGGQDGAEERKELRRHIVITQPGHNRGMCPPYCVPSKSLALYTNAMTQGSDGALYGTTPGVRIVLDPQGDVSTIAPTIFKISPDGNLSTLYTFTGATDGGGSSQGLFLAGDGNFYSTSGSTIFQLTPSGTFNTIYTPEGNSIGSNFGALLQGSDGLLYSEAEGGGSATACSGDGCGTIFTLATSPAIPPPMQLTLSSSTSPLGSPVTLSWAVANAYSLSMQQCYAFVQNGATTAGNWGGLQSGTFNNTEFTGSVTLTPIHVGTYTYALTCGGIESGFAALTVPNPSISTSSSLPSGQVSTSYTQTLNVDGGAPPYTWTVTAGSLPTGLSLSSAGLLSGVPTQSGNYTFTVRASDSEVPAVTMAATFTLSIQDFSLGVSPLNLTIAQGQQGIATFTVTGIEGYALPVTLSCSGLPSEATCSFSPASVIPTGSGATTTLTITTTRSTAMLIDSASRRNSRGFAGTAALAILLLLCVPFRRKRFTAELFLILIVGFALLSTVSACGGGNAGNGGNTSNPGTQIGTSQVIVTAASTGSGAIQHMISLTVTVTN